MGTRALVEYVRMCILEKTRNKKGIDKSVLKRYGNKFDLERLSKFDSVHMMYVYANYFLELLGQESARAAFLISSRYVLKIALGQKGIAQNHAEHEMISNKLTGDITTKIHGSDPSERWLLVDLVKPLKSEAEFKQLAGVDWDTFVDNIERYAEDEEDVTRNYTKRSDNITNKHNKRTNGATSTRTTATESVRSISEDDLKSLDEFSRIVINVVKANKLLPGDVKRLEHWGKTADGRCVLLDYGATEQVFNDYYSN